MSQNPPVIKVPVCSTYRRRKCRVESLIAERRAQILKLGPAYFPADVAAHKLLKFSNNTGIFCASRTFVRLTSGPR